MKHQDGMDKARDYFVDSLIDDAIENERSRTLHQKGRLLKERCAREIDARYVDKIIQRDLRVDSESV